MSFQLEERRVSEDGFAYSKEEFSSHYKGLAQWNAASVETKYDRDGNTYTQRAFFEHYGGVDQWYSAIPANAYSDSRKPTATTSSAAVGDASASQPHTHTAYHDGWYSDRSTGSMGPTGWSSDRGPQANPDDGFFDTQGYGDHYISYDDMAISSNLHSHMAGRGHSGSSRRASRDRLTASSSSSSSSSRPSTSVPRGALPSLRNTNRRGLSRSNSDTSIASSNSGGGTTGARPSTSSHSSSPSSTSPDRGKRRRSGRVERSLSSLGRKLFSHIPPKQLKVMVTPTNANNSNKRKTTAHLEDGLSLSATSMSTSTPSLYERKQKLLNNKYKSKRHPASLLASDVSPLSKSTSNLPISTTPSLLPAINTPSASNNTPLSGASINIDDYISVHCNVTKRYRLCRVLDMKDGNPPTVQVHFEGTPVVPDEYLPFDSSRLAPFDRSQSSPTHGMSKRVLVAKSQYVNVGDYCEVRVFCENDFKFQMAQIISLNNNDGSIQVHVEGMPNTEDECIPMADVPLRVRAMSIGVHKLNDSPVKQGSMPPRKNNPKGMKSTGATGTVGVGQSAAPKDAVLSESDISPKNQSSVSSCSTENIDEITYTSSSSDEDEEHEDDETNEEKELTNSGKIKQMKSSKSELSKALRKLGLKIIKIAADGNCLFRAVAHQLYVDVSRHEELRKQCCDYMLEHRIHFEHYVDGSFDKYLKKMRKDTTWGGNLEITAMSELCDRKITIHSKDDVKEYNFRLQEKETERKKKTMMLTKTKKQRNEEKPQQQQRQQLSTKPERTVPALVLKHDFDTSACAATPRPSHIKTPDPIQLSYHGQSHYNSVVDPRTPLPLAPLSTSYIRQGRMLREEQTVVGVKTSASPATTTTSLNDLKNSNQTKKVVVKDKKSKRRAFFNFRGKKQTDTTNPPHSNAPPQSNTKQTTPRSLKPLDEVPDLKQPNEPTTKDRQRPSLPSLPSLSGTNKSSSGGGGGGGGGGSNGSSGTQSNRNTIPKLSNSSPRPNHEFIEKADLILKTNMEQLEQRLGKKMISQRNKNRLKCG